MAVINYDSELKRAGAHAPHGWRRLAFLARRYVLGTAGLSIMLMFVWAAIFANLICRFDPLSVDSAHRLAAPSALHWMGTDSFGRDVWSRIIHGARISLAVGIGSTALGSSIGVIVGLTSGYLSGWVDLVFQRVTDMLQALPLLVLALVMTAALGPSLPNVILAIAIPLIPTVSRVIRANTLALRELPFVEAAKSIGMSETRIALRHILPNTLAPLIVLATAQLGSTILTEASLSFLGLGIPEPYPSRGRMLSESAARYVRTAPRLVIFRVAINIAVCSVPICSATRCATSSIRGSAADERGAQRRDRARRQKTLERCSSPIPGCFGRSTTFPLPFVAAQTVAIIGRSGCSRALVTALVEINAAGARPAGPDRRRLHPAGRYRPARARRGRNAGDPRQPDLDDLRGNR